jgi:hypothetical protein
MTRPAQQELIGVLERAGPYLAALVVVEAYRGGLVG